MKISLSLLFVLFATLSLAQTDKPFVVNLEIKNQITGALVDATLEWTDDSAIKRNATGKYALTLPEGTSGSLMISRQGYFESKVELDYETEKSLSIHEIKLQPEIPQLFLTVLDDETSQTLTTDVDLFTMSDSSIVFSDEVKVSPYTIDLEYNQAHILQVRKPGYFSFKDTIDFTNVFEGKTRERKIRLVPLKAGNKISLNNIYFKENESSLTGFAQLMLAELSHVLEQQKGIVIEIGAYTDGLGSDEYNKSLSEKRALSVKNYLVKSGAGNGQLIAKGYGEISPVAPNDTEANRALNRRVEFKIVSIK
jgi:outer membrane protein OmpA-like peptidoglycan-associated protein